MPSRYVEVIYDVLSDEPVTPNEIAKKLGITHKTAKDALMHRPSRGRTCTTRTLGGYICSGSPLLKEVSR